MRGIQDANRNVIARSVIGGPGRHRIITILSGCPVLLGFELLPGLLFFLFLLPFQFLQPFFLLVVYPFAHNNPSSHLRLPGDVQQ
jgi:hypothetical protein